MLTDLAREVLDTFLAEVDRRLPGDLVGLFLHGSICWGEFFGGSDLDFVAVWDELPAGERLGELREAHEWAQAAVPAPAFDGFHCTAADLGRHPAAIEHRPVLYQGVFSSEGRTDISLVTWHELASRPVVVRGEVPPVYTNLAELISFTRTNLDTYWRGQLAEVTRLGARAFGENDDAVAWVVLGAARLHHLLTQRALTSKSGAGRYVVDHLDPRWEPIATEALRIRETPEQPSRYPHAEERGRDARDLLAWLIDDGTPTG